MQPSRMSRERRKVRGREGIQNIRNLLFYHDLADMNRRVMGLRDRRYFREMDMGSTLAQR